MSNTADKVSVSEALVTQIKPSPEAQAYIDKVAFVVDRHGLQACMALSPPTEAMLASLAHCVANKKFSPEYQRVMDDVLMLLVVQAKTKEMLRKQAAEHGQQLPENFSVTPYEMDDTEMQAVMPQEVQKPFCNHCDSHHDVATKSAAFIGLTPITDQNDHRSVMISFLERKEHDSPGLHVVMARGEIDAMIGALSKIRDSHLKDQKPQ